MHIAATWFSPIRMTFSYNQVTLCKRVTSVYSPKLARVTIITLYSSHFMLIQSHARVTLIIIMVSTVQKGHLCIAVTLLFSPKGDLYNMVSTVQKGHFCIAVTLLFSPKGVDLYNGFHCAKGPPLYLFKGDLYNMVSTMQKGHLCIAVTLLFSPKGDLYIPLYKRATSV